MTEHDIPSPPGLPWIGNLLQIPTSRITQYLLETSRNFDGILALDFAGARLPFVFDPELVKELSDPTRFHKAIGPPLSTLRRLAGDGLFTARGDEPNWGKAHRILLPAFSQRAMKGYFPMMLEVAEQLAAKWTRGGPDADIAVADDMTRLTLDTISLAGFGYRFESFARDALHPFLDAMVDVLAEVMRRLTRLPIQNRLMRSSLRRIDRDIAQMHPLVDEVIASRRAAGHDQAPTRDLLGLMLQARDPLTGEALDSENIRSQVITFLIAGHETTSGLLTFALYLLMRHPEVLARCYAEVDRVMPPGQAPRYEHLAQLDVIERVLRETLRLWPTAPSYALSANDDTVLGGRYRLRKGQRVIVFLPALHRHPRYWPRPDAFDVDRFLPAARAQFHPHAYKPFGNGERACIGQQFALTEAKLALAVILQRFALSDPHDYRLAIKETLTLKPDGFRLRARPRPLPAGVAGQAREGSPASTGPALTAEVRVNVGASITANATPDAGASIAAPGPRTGSAPGPTWAASPGATGQNPFRVLYGSSVGTCQEIAVQVAELARRAGFEPEVLGLDEGVQPWPTQGWLIVVTSTYNGRAPDNARRLEALLDAGAGAEWRAPALRYAVLGCGNSQWPAYQAFPKRVAELLSASGAQELLARTEADGNSDFELAIDDWTRQLEAALIAQRPAPPAHPSSDSALSVTISDPSSLRQTLLAPGTQTFRVLDTSELVHEAHGLWDFGREAPRASTRHLRIALPPGVSYATGDHLAVYPHNDPERVAALIERLGLDRATTVTVSGDSSLTRHLPPGQPIALWQLLSEFVELQDPAARRDIERLVAHTRCPDTRARLARWLGDGPADDAARALRQAELNSPRVSVTDLLARLPAIELPLAQFLQTCAAMRPRWYSVASSALASPDEISLTVGALEAPAIGGPGVYRGVASRYLCRLSAGATIAARLRTPQPDFAPPADPSVPLVMIGPGTGIAPFRGFIEERAWHLTQGHAVGAALLFSGARHPAHDRLHAPELLRWSASGAFKWVEAYSCVDDYPWRFVQDAVWAWRDELWRLIGEGARVYLCGDGKAMAPAVRETLLRICREQSGQSEPAARQWLDDLIGSGRFRQDVFN